MESIFVELPLENEKTVVVDLNTVVAYTELDNQSATIYLSNGAQFIVSLNYEALKSYLPVRAVLYFIPEAA
jgi:hypothetical protein